jgi:hypothetical protein
LWRGATHTIGEPGGASYHKENTTMPFSGSGSVPSPYQSRTEGKMDFVLEGAWEAYKKGAIPVYLGSIFTHSIY